jgi:integrase
MGLVKRGDTFHFRCRVPSDLRELLGRSEIHATLRTGTRRIALQREGVIQANLAIWFQRLRIARESSVDKPQLASIVECLLSDIGSSQRRRASAHEAESPKRLSELMKLHLREKEGLLTARSFQKMTYSYRLALKLIGDIELDQVNRSVCRSYRDALSELPQRALGNETKSQGCLSPKTINHHLQYLSGLLRWATREELVHGNSAEGLLIQRCIPAWSERHSFSDSDLQVLLGSLLRQEERVERRWIPLIGLWSGLRLEEICQLRHSDMSEIDGTWCFNVNKSAGHLKTPSAERLVPIHPWLIQRGLLEEIGRQKLEVSQSQVWSGLARDSFGRYSNGFGKWFGRYKTKQGFQARVQCFHSLRHNFTDRLKQNSVSEPIIRQLVGHSEQSITLGRYGKPYGVRALANAISQLDFEIE